MARHVPVAKPVFICDEIVRDSTSNKTSILNMFDFIRAPASSSFPFQLRKLCVFAEMSDGFGEFMFRVEIARLDSGDVVISSTERSFDFTDRLKNVVVLFRMLDCRFPVAGHYLVQLYCEEDVVGDRVLHVIAAGNGVKT